MSSLGSDRWPGKENANSGLTCALENLENFAGDLRAILDLVDDPDLHVIYNQRQPRRMTNIFQRLRNIQSECPLHDESPLKSDRIPILPKAESELGCGENNRCGTFPYTHVTSYQHSFDKQVTGFVRPFHSRRIKPFKHAEDSLHEHARGFDWGTPYKQVSLKRT